MKHLPRSDRMIDVYVWERANLLLMTIYYVKSGSINCHNHIVYVHTGTIELLGTVEFWKE